MMGDIAELINAMKRHDRSERLKNLSFEDKP